MKTNIKNPDSKCLELVISNIAVKTKAFSKDSFSETYPSIKFHVDRGSIRNWILLLNLPNTIPAFEGNLRKEKLLTRYKDGDKTIEEYKDCFKILNVLNNPEPFTILEFWAIHRELFQKLNRGKNVLTSCYGPSHLFFVRLNEKKAVIVDTHYDNDDENGGYRREWIVNIDDPDSHIQYMGGQYIFSRE